ncbi:MAG: 1-deoxy-D-xylulose-5-phosphate reductoisomerase [Thermacetogeniaceae bacterium]|jgi:1-deoxy-D-xylulose-5-phosphate reductoisomerase|nr:1-deoxy-D-xylulose-5-phosphate reductoisomerase [Thermoanaerobacterales bacterium]NLN20654.1 1-deoxy-D-xylulose-5-phosphate reductoisomerase [Syntrophomonadaceae bacterium]
MKKNIVILGSTGSIGRQALEVIEWHRSYFNVLGLAARNNIDLLEKQVRAFRVPYAAVQDTAAAKQFAQRLKGEQTQCLSGDEGLLELVRHPDADLILVAVNGLAGLLPTLEAISYNKKIALANKETLVAGGALVMEAAHAKGVQIIPVDSEHSAIFQCLEKMTAVDRLILTGSGGPFRKMQYEDLKKVTPEMALRHPTWQMGEKITVDSATLMNKGLEIIEARWLFGIDYDQIDVVIHPQSIIHSLVAYKDSSVLAQMGYPDMRLPIQYAFFYPERKSNSLKIIDLVQLGALTFEPPDTDRFPCLRLAREAGKIGGTMTTVLNAANEMAVYAFLRGMISFTAIAEMVHEVMGLHDPSTGIVELEEILEADRWARVCARRLIQENES